MITAKQAWEIRNNRQKSEIQYWLYEIEKRIRQDAYDINLDLTVVHIKEKWWSVDYCEVVQEIVKQLEENGFKVKILESEDNLIPIYISWENKDESEGETWDE